MELPENEIWPLRSAAILHDIGNYNMEGSLLEKSKLTDDEQEQLKKHAENSAEVAINLNASPEVGKIIRHHHERYDGEGYPDGLTEETIPLGSRILAVADAYVAMRSERAFRSALPEVRALNELRSHSGKQFDPSVIEALINYLEQEGDA
jgi:putative nucleotidyltransferase with HDIG domain